MTHIYYANNGRIVAESSIPLVAPPETKHLITDIPPPVGANYYVSEDVLILFPEGKATAFHQFDYLKKQWLDPRTEQDYIAANRAKRDALLAASDWTQLPDVPTATQQLWTLYRQALRDITKQADQTNIVWPIAPI